ncbi:MAG: sigma factor [Pirellulaceae bacterium]
MTHATPSRQFHSTRWSLIAQAQAGSSLGRSAVQELCEQYWFPLYAYFRSRGFQAADARDLTQELFAGMISRDGFGRATPTKGRFRSYLLVAAKNLILEQRRNCRAQKRGGEVATWSIDWSSAEGRLQWEPVDPETAEQVFERQWAKQVLADAMHQLDELNNDPTRREYYLRFALYRDGLDEPALCTGSR